MTKIIEMYNFHSEKHDQFKWNQFREREIKK